MEEIIGQKKLWHIAFSFDEPRPGVITLPGKDAEEAKAMLMQMVKHMHNVVIHDVVDAELLPNIQDMLQRQADAEALHVDDVEMDPDEKDLLN